MSIPSYIKPIIEMLVTDAPKYARPALRENGKDYLIEKVFGVAVHYAANSDPRATAINTAKYFNGTKTRYASAHYIVDENDTVICIPENEVAFHVGSTIYAPLAARYTTERNGKSKNPNYSLIGVEICNNGDWTKACILAAELIADITIRHGLTIKDVVRHYDITGKICPKPMIEEKAWQSFLRLVESKRFELFLGNMEDKTSLWNNDTNGLVEDYQTWIESHLKN